MSGKEKADSGAEYESELDDASLPAVRRRSWASDEEEEDGRQPSRMVGPDADSDGQGAAEMYDDEEFYDEEEYEEFEEVYKEIEAGGDDVYGGGEADADAEAAAGQGEAKAEAEEAAAARGEEKGKMASDPYTVPTAGAFYMHDDRFQENGSRRRQRFQPCHFCRTLGGQKSWNRNGGQAWVHDRFNENLHDSQHSNARGRPRGRFIGRGGGRTRGVDRGYYKGNRYRSYYNDNSNYFKFVPKEALHYNCSKNYNRVPKESNTFYGNAKNYKSVPKQYRAYNDDAKNFDINPRESHTYYSDAKSHNDAPKLNRGRGSRQYQLRWKRISEISPAQKNKSQKSEEASSSANAGKHSSQTSSLQHENDLPMKQTVASNLNSTSQNSGEASSNANAEKHSSRTSSLQPENDLPRKQTIASNLNSASPRFCPSRSSHQELPFIQRGNTKPGSSNEAPSHPQPSLISLMETGTPPVSNKSIAHTPVKGQNGNQGAEKASFLYVGEHVLGATGTMGLTLGDQGFPGTPALLPVVQFNGQHFRGPGVPSIGMALPGFVAEQQLGTGNSEMTLLPVLTGAAGALPAAYGPPYIVQDGSHHPQPSEHASSSVSPGDYSATKGPISLKSVEIPEVVKDELSQRQNMPRRYSEMKFGS